MLTLSRRTYVWVIGLILILFSCSEPEIPATVMNPFDDDGVAQVQDRGTPLDRSTDSEVPEDIDSGMPLPTDMEIDDQGSEGGAVLPPEDMEVSIDQELDESLPISNDMFVDDQSFDERWPDSWVIFGGNPILYPSSGTQSQGLDNIYAPHVLWHQDQWWMWYGGQGADGKDAIFLAWSQDLVTWSKYGNPDPIPVVDHAASNHVNDPSVVWAQGMFYMYYTEAPIGEEDEVHLATSADGITWEKQGAVIDVGAPGSWESDRVGRPSVLYEEGEFRMWYDGQIYGVARHVGYATSSDGLTWTKHPNNPILLNEGAIDVAKVGDRYVMLVEGHTGTRSYHSSDRLSWNLQGTVISLSGDSYDSFGQVTPHLVTHQGEVRALFYGGASNPCWCKNRIAAVFPAGAEPEIQDCSACLQGFDSCELACQSAGFSSGVCSAPGSTDPNVCCACMNELDCSACLQGFESCEQACQSAGFSSGVCGAPGSTDPGVCCACQ